MSAPDGPGAGRLLILDDDAAVGQTIMFVAEAAGMEARWVSAPQDFLREVAQWNPSHVAIDLVMPEMDGVEVIALLAERGCRARIIISSGVGSRVLDAARRSASEHGLDIAGVLPKPFMPATLRALLSEPAPPPRPPPGTMPARPEPEVTEAELRGALERREFELAYQPKIRCATRALAGFEALVRWKRPHGALVMPDRFIPLAESAGLIDALTEQVFEQSLRWFSEAFPDSGLSLSVNISARSLGDFRLGDHVAGLGREYLVDAGRLVLELTESSTMLDPTASLALLTRLRVRGYELSIDDFGTGYSSMVQLVRLPFSEMKVDKSFVMTAAQSEESRTVIRSIVDLGHSLGLRVIAEGVEDAGTLAYLRDVGCDLAQGYYISRPMPGSAVAAWIESWQARLQPATAPDVG
ncbi:MAG TPA: EAL domain-containing response regulator [Solimonas sp.]|nr:EAL domain-containing response regulator [Solimonas sp.]